MGPGYAALRWMLNIMDVSGELAHCWLSLSEFEFDVMHRAGIKHQAADPLSPLPNDGEDTTHLNNALLVLTIVLAGKAKETEGIDEDTS